MYCRTCGEKLADGSLSCPNCGADTTALAGNEETAKPPKIGFNGNKTNFNPIAAKEINKIVTLVISALFIIIGFILFIIAEVEISNNRLFYTWTPPYTKYEAHYITLRLVGIMLPIAGVLNVGLTFLINHLKGKKQFEITRGAK